jgi:3-dehydroquinate synthase
MNLATVLPPIEMLTVAMGERSYAINIGAGLLQQLTPIIEMSAGGRIVVVSNTTVFPLYGQTLVAQLNVRGIETLVVVLPDGEGYKDWQTLQLIFDTLVTHACDRKTSLLALGGGVVGDMVGFAASAYQRGISFIQLPTTLLAQVDSSVGGKTAINHPLGKNMIGAFYQPKLVVIDTDTLATLPAREYQSGLAEIIKYGVALDRPFFDWLEENMQALIQRDGAALAYAIRRSCEIKAAVVADDEFETKKIGGRALLNFGHTFGHAIEIALGYGEWLHGEAVACGMAIAAEFSFTLGRIDSQTAARIVAVIKQAGLPTVRPDISADTMIEHMSRDKKNEAGTIRLILLDAIGQSQVDGSVSREAIHAFLAGDKK